MKKYIVKTGSFRSPLLSGKCVANSPKEALNQYVKDILSGAGLIEIFEVDADDKCKSIHQTAIGSNVFKSVEKDKYKEFATHVGDEMFPHIYERLGSRNISVFDKDEIKEFYESLDKEVA